MTEIDIVSKVLHVDRNEWVRSVLAHETKKELEEHKAFVALEYVRGNISKAELVKGLGKEAAADIVDAVKTTKKGFTIAKTWAKRA